MTKSKINKESNKYIHCSQESPWKQAVQHSPTFNCRDGGKLEHNVTLLAFFQDTMTMADIALLSVYSVQRFRTISFDFEPTFLN